MESNADILKRVLLEAREKPTRGKKRGNARGRGEALKGAKHRTPGALVNRTRSQVEKGLEKTNTHKRETARANEARARRQEDEREARAKNKQYRVT